MALQDDIDSPLAKAVRIVGTQAKFGELVGKAQSRVNHWLKHNIPLPAESVIAVEKATGISRHDLRPDIYPREEQSSPARHSAEQPPAPPASCPNEVEDAGGPCSSQPDGRDPAEGLAA